MNINKININQSEQTYYIESDIYDVTANNNGAVFESLQSLLSSDNLSTLIPTEVRYGGMNIRFVQSSDNTYVQYRLITTSFSTTESDWQNVAIIGTERIADGAVTTDKIADNSVTPEKLKYWTLPVFNNGVYNYNGNWTFKTFATHTTTSLANGLAAIRIRASSANKICDVYANFWLGDSTGAYPSFILLGADYNIIDTIYLPDELFDGRITNAITGVPITNPRAGYFKLSVPIAEILQKYPDAFILAFVISDAPRSTRQSYLICEQNLGLSVDLAFALRNPPAPYRIYSDKIAESAITTVKLADNSVTYKKMARSFSYDVLKSIARENSYTWYNSKEIPISIESHYLKNDGESIQENSNYNIVDYLLVPKNVILTFNKLYSTNESNFITYDAYFKLISAENVEGSITIDTRDGKDRYIKFSYDKTKSDLSDFSLERAIPEFANGNVLYAKKYVACGDSFTHGDFSSTSVDGNPEEGSTEYESTYDKRMGTYKTYPYWIAARNNMKLVNLAKNGDKLVNFAQESNLSQIPEDADYITIKYGINDSHQSVPIGTLSDTDNTTFLGAWNIVLTWLITNRPNAKIGIIASNGCDTEEYSKASVQAAKKYGILYIDEENGENVPYFLRQTFKANNQGIPSAIKSLRTAQYRVSPTNGHPNIEAHKFESTFIEAWMRTL